MSNIILEEQPEYYDIIPEYNSTGRLCNYHTGEGETVRVMAGEWERFNQLAGRQHEVVDGVVVYNEELEPCMPDSEPEPPTVEELKAQITELENENLSVMMAAAENYELALSLQEENLSVMVAVTELYETIIGG